MTADGSTNARLAAAPWLRTAAIAQVFATLDRTCGVSRAVGGAVRNTLLGEPIDDIDIATTATPEAVLAAAGRAGVKAIATGLEHGTVTLVVDGVPFEVTTLRRDVATDGRHATVAFTDDWALDASRRDFTINALYCDSAGTLFDPLGGAADLAPTRIRFIGDARARLREDYLRILRFFRFSARYAEAGLDAEGLAACDAERGGLARISAERIRAELLKLLVSPRAAAICRIMQAHGFLVPLLGAAPYPGRLERLAAIEEATGRRADPVLRLAALALDPDADAAALAGRLRLPGRDRDRLAALAEDWAGTLSAVGPTATQSDHRAIYRRGTAGFCDSLLVAWAGAITTPPNAPAWRARLAHAADWPRPRFPITGQDALTLGLAPGPSVGRLLAGVEAWWIANDFVADRSACLGELAKQAARG